MKRMHILLGTAAVAAGMFLLLARAGAQDKPAGDKPAQAKPAPEKAAPKAGEQDPMAEMMAKWKEINAKGPEHEKLKKMVGEWDTEMKCWMAPDAEPMASPGHATFRLILDGRYVEQKYTCDWMGEKFEGLGIDGYDRIKNKYVSLWLDNQSTGMLICEGTADASGKVVTYFGKMDDPIAGVKDKTVRSVARTIDDNKTVFEMYDTAPDGKEFKTMEITYTRQKTQK
jgi:hypothetical protein